MTTKIKTFDISYNIFYGIIFADAQPERKLRTIAELLSFDTNLPPAENMARLPQFESFTEYLQSEYERLEENLKTITASDMPVAMDANRAMQGIYAVLNDACTIAAKQNKQERDRLCVPGAFESAMSKLVRESKMKAIEEHVGVLGNCAIDVMRGYADVVTQSTRILAPQDNTVTQAAQKPTSSALPQELHDAITALKKSVPRRPAAGLSV